MATDHPREHDCALVRESLSARADGEVAALPLADVDDHLRSCRACARFEATVGDVNRRVRLVTADPVPDLTGSIAAALAADRTANEAVGTPPAPSQDRGWHRLRGPRLVVAFAGLAQLALAVPLLAGLVGGHDPHLLRELGTVEAALGIGLLVAAVQPRRAPGVLPVIAAVALLAVAAAGVDVVAGRAAPTDELVHLSELAGVVALWVLVRRLPGTGQDRRVATPARPAVSGA